MVEADIKIYLGRDAANSLQAVLIHCWRAAANESRDEGRKR